VQENRTLVDDEQASDQRDELVDTLARLSTVLQLGQVLAHYQAAGVSTAVRRFIEAAS